MKKNKGMALIRILTLGLRFLLLFLVVRYYGVESAGIYTLILAIVSPSPAFIGLGVNYFIPRFLVKNSPDKSLSILKGKLVLSAISSAVIFTLILPFYLNFKLIKEYYFLVCLLCFLEVITYDLYVYLIGINRSFEANLHVFIKSAAWIPPYVICEFIWGGSVELLLWFWLVFSIILFAIFFIRERIFYADFSYGFSSVLKILTQKINFGVYVNELANALYVNVDRYLVSYFFGLAWAGVYGYYLSFFSAVLALISATLVVPMIPNLIENVEKENNSKYFYSFFKKNTLMAIGMSVAAFCFASILAKYVGRYSFEEYGGFWLPLALAFNCVALVSSLSLHFVLFAFKKDGLILALNLSSLSLSTILMVVAGLYAGILYFVFSVVFVSAVVVIIKFIMVRKQLLS